MALIDRIFRDPADDESRHIHNHLIAAAFWMWARGDITRAQLVTAMGLDVQDDAQIDELKATYDALATQAEKDRFFGDFTAWTVAAEEGKITKGQFRTKFGLT